LGEYADGDRVIKRKRCFEMRPGGRKPAGKHQPCPHGAMTETQSDRIIAFPAQTQQLLGQVTGQSLELKG